jgi:hypothetical protein
VTVELGTNTVLGVDPDGLYTIPEMLAEGRRPPREIALWDGKAGERAAEVLTEFLASPRAHGPKHGTAGSDRKSTSDGA